jgi:hypothetical protein
MITKKVAPPSGADVDAIRVRAAQPGGRCHRVDRARRRDNRAA